MAENNSLRRVVENDFRERAEMPIRMSWLYFGGFEHRSDMIGHILMVHSGCGTGKRAQRAEE